MEEFVTVATNAEHLNFVFSPQIIPPRALAHGRVGSRERRIWDLFVLIPNNLPRAANKPRVRLSEATQTERVR